MANPSPLEEDSIERITREIIYTPNFEHIFHRPKPQAYDPTTLGPQCLPPTRPQQVATEEMQQQQHHHHQHHQQQPQQQHHHQHHQQQPQQQQQQQQQASIIFETNDLPQLPDLGPVLQLPPITPGEQSCPSPTCAPASPTVCYPQLRQQIQQQQPQQQQPQMHHHQQQPVTYAPNASDIPQAQHAPQSHWSSQHQIYNQVASEQVVNTPNFTPPVQNAPRFRQVYLQQTQYSSSSFDGNQYQQTFRQTQQNYTPQQARLDVMQARAVRTPTAGLPMADVEAPADVTNNQARPPYQPHNAHCQQRVGQIPSSACLEQSRQAGDGTCAYVAMPMPLLQNQQQSCGNPRQLFIRPLVHNNQYQASQQSASLQQGVPAFTCLANSLRSTPHSQPGILRTTIQSHRANTPATRGRPRKIGPRTCTPSNCNTLISTGINPNQTSQIPFVSTNPTPPHQIQTQLPPANPVATVQNQTPPPVSVSSTTTGASRQPSKPETVNKGCQVDPKPVLLVHRSLNAVPIMLEQECQTDIEEPSKKEFVDRACSPIVLNSGPKRKFTPKRRKDLCREPEKDDTSDDEIDVIE